MFDENNEPLKNANVAIVDNDYGTNTDSNGKFVIADVPVGRYLLEVTFVGYQLQQKEIDVREGQTTTNTYKLARSILEFSTSEVIFTGQQTVG